MCNIGDSPKTIIITPFFLLLKILLKFSQKMVQILLILILIFLNFSLIFTQIFPMGSAPLYSNQIQWPSSNGVGGGGGYFSGISKKDF